MGQRTLTRSAIGGAYLAVVGGAAALQTTWIEAIEEVDFDELNPESLWKFRIKGSAVAGDHGVAWRLAYDRVKREDAAARRGPWRHRRSDST